MSDMNRLLNQIGQQIKAWLREGGDSASEWWEDKSAIHARMKRMRQLGRQRREILQSLGAKVYTLHKRDKVRNADLIADCRKLDEIGAEIERLKREIEEIRDRERGLSVEEPPLTDDTPVVDDEEADTPIAVEVSVVSEAEEDPYDVSRERGGADGPGEEAGAGEES